MTCKHQSLEEKKKWRLESCLPTQRVSSSPSIASSTSPYCICSLHPSPRVALCSRKSPFSRFFLSTGGCWRPSVLEDGIPWHLGGLEGAWQRRSKSKTAGVGIGTKVSFLLSPASHAELGRMPSERRESKRGSRGRQTGVYLSAVPPTPPPPPLAGKTGCRELQRAQGPES